MSPQLTCHEALQLTASFACSADRMRAGKGTCEIRTRICETASRVAFLKAHRMAQREEMVPLPGHTFRRANFTIA